jgi:hypothetical protein
MENVNKVLKYVGIWVLRLRPAAIWKARLPTLIANVRIVTDECIELSLVRGNVSMKISSKIEIRKSVSV